MKKTYNPKLRKLYRKLDRRYKKHDILLKNIKKHLPEMELALNTLIRSEGRYEGSIYRFYHYSFKVYYLQESTEEIIKILRKINPNRPKEFCELFEGIIKDARLIGAWKLEHNVEWPKYTRPIVEAFLHAKYFLEMAIICGKEMDKAPQMITQRWAALLELYNIR